jgi:predicted TIM-barrel fold metal-dependent hydrolase
LFPSMSVIDAVAPYTPTGAVAGGITAGADSPSVTSSITPEQLVAKMDLEGMERVLIPARKYGSTWEVSYEVLRDFVAERPDRLSATAGINPNERMPGVRRFERAVTEWGFVGAHSYSTWSGIRADDRLYYPYYAKAEELGVPFQIECYRNSHGPVSCTPDQIQQIAWDFPGLKIVAIHTGFPWIDDLVSITSSVDNVYLGCDIDPWLWTPSALEFISGTGRGARMVGQKVFGRIVTDTADRTIFGTNSHLDIPRATAFFETLGLSDDVMRRLLSENARTLYNLPAAA